MKPLPFPRRINVEPTNLCNQRCRLCPRQELTRPLGFMPLSLFEKIATECARYETRLWLHFLGEPLLHRDLIDMIRCAKDAGVAEIGLSTNAVALATYAEAILDSGLDRLECSIDALDRPGFEAMRGRDHFPRVVRNVRGFLDRKRRRGSTSPVTSLQFMRTGEMDRRQSSVLAEWQPYLGDRDFIMMIEPATFLGSVAVDVDVDGAPGARRPCAWLFESLVILQDGTITACGADWDARSPIGNVRESDIATIWRGREMERRRRAHLDGRFADVGDCERCEDWRLADGRGYVRLGSGG